MNDFETEIPIIDGWKKIRVRTDGNPDMFLPSDSILDRLIRFPSSLYIDTYRLDKYRIKPQVFDEESQLFLQKRSNTIVEYLLSSPLTEYEIKISKWCEDNYRNSGVILFHKKLIDYCNYILPGLNSNRKKESVIAAVSRGEWNPSDPDFRAKYKNIDWVYWRKKKRDRFSLMKRFPEYIGAKATLQWIDNKFDKSIFLDEHDSINKDNTWFENHKNNLFGKNGSLQKFKGTLPLTLGKGTLTQCLFCYRFHLQHLGKGNKKSSLSRCCNREQCKAMNHKWENKFPLNFDIKYADIPLYGIPHAELLLLDVEWGDDRIHFDIKQADVPLSGF
jgi:hypothetical protein